MNARPLVLFVGLVMVLGGRAHAQLPDGEQRFNGTVTDRTRGIRVRGNFRLDVHSGELSGVFTVEPPLSVSAVVRGRESGGQCRLTGFYLDIDFGGTCDTRRFVGSYRVRSTGEGGDFVMEVPTLGVKYGTREPAVCSSMLEPTGGAPTPAQAARYFQCQAEADPEEHVIIGDTKTRLHLIENITVEVG